MAASPSTVDKVPSIRSGCFFIKNLKISRDKRMNEQFINNMF